MTDHADDHADEASESDRWLACQLELLADQAELDLRKVEWRRAVRGLSGGIFGMTAAEGRRTFDTLIGCARGLRAGGDPVLAALFEAFAQFVAAAQFEEFGSSRIAEMGLKLFDIET